MNILILSHDIAILVRAELIGLRLDYGFELPYVIWKDDANTDWKIVHYNRYSEKNGTKEF